MGSRASWPRVRMRIGGSEVQDELRESQQAMREEIATARAAASAAQDSNAPCEKHQPEAFKEKQQERDAAGADDAQELRLVPAQPSPASRDSSSQEAT